MKEESSRALSTYPVGVTRNLAPRIASGAPSSTGTTTPSVVEKSSRVVGASYVVFMADNAVAAPPVPLLLMWHSLAAAEEAIML